MKSPRINWRSKTISAIMRIDGLSTEEATSKFNRLYRQARQSIGPHQKEVNVTRELYGSLVYKSVHTFQVGDSGNKVELNKIIDPSKLRASITRARMKGFFETYGQVPAMKQVFDELLSDLETGKLSQKEFNERIKIFKKWNTKYLIAGS